MYPNPSKGLLKKPNYQLDVYRMWRSAILRYCPNAYIDKQNVLQSGYCKQIKDAVFRFDSEEDLPHFFDVCIGQFSLFCPWAAKNYCLFNFPMFPTLRYLSKHLHVFLNWYRVYTIEQSIRPALKVVGSDL